MPDYDDPTFAGFLNVSFHEEDPTFRRLVAHWTESSHQQNLPVVPQQRDQVERSRELLRAAVRGFLIHRH